MSGLAKIGLCFAVLCTAVTIRFAEYGWRELTARFQSLPYERREMDRLALPRMEEPLSEIIVYMQANGEPLFVSLSTRSDHAFVYDCNGMHQERTRSEIVDMLRELRELGGYQRPFEQLCPPHHVVATRRPP